MAIPSIHPPRPPQHQSSTPTHHPPSSTHQPSTPHPSKSTIIHINIYDLLPPSPLSTLLYALGLPLVHTSLFIPALALEYSYGCILSSSPSSSPSNQSGIYATASPTPHLYPPPGTRFLHSMEVGTVNMSAEECGRVVRGMGPGWRGREYDLLGRNCNHFVEAAVGELFDGSGGKGVPGWCNRAARWGRWMPWCVPGSWMGDEDDEGSVDEEGEEDVRGVGNGVVGKGYRDEEEAIASPPFTPKKPPETNDSDEKDDTFPLLTSPPLRPHTTLPEPDAIRHIERRRSSEAGDGRRSSGAGGMGDRRRSSGAGGRELGVRRRSSAATNGTTFSGKGRRRSGTLDAEGRALPLSEIVPLEPPHLVAGTGEEEAIT